MFTVLARLSPASTVIVYFIANYSRRGNGIRPLHLSLDVRVKYDTRAAPGID
jgi:hypothetical protein